MQVEKIIVGKVPVAVYKPEGFQPGKKYPVWLFMHGKSEMSEKTSTVDELTRRVVNNGNHSNLLAMADSEGWIVIAPLLVQSLNEWTPGWTNSYLKSVYDYILKADFTDLAHIKVTGLSLGGGGVWVAISGEFAPYVSAAVPICGTPQYDQDFSVVAKNNIPVWAFHAKDDSTVSYTHTVNQVGRIKAAGANPEPKMTLPDSGNHFIWGKVYADPEMYKWAMEQRNDTGVVTPPPVIIPADEIIATIKTTIYKSGKVESIKI